MLVPIDPEVYDELTDDTYDDFHPGRRLPPLRFRGIAPRHKKRRFSVPTPGKAPESIFISPKRLRELRQQKQKKKSSRPVEKTQPKPKKTSAKPLQEQNKNAAEKAMDSDTKAAKPAKAIAIALAITTTVTLAYLAWKQHKKQVI